MQEYALLSLGHGTLNLPFSNENKNVYINMYKYIHTQEYNKSLVKMHTPPTFKHRPKTPFNT